MSWSDDIRCLYCDGRLPLYRKITHGQFCSSAHRKSYWKEQERLAVERLAQTHNSLRAFAPPPSEAADLGFEDLRRPELALPPAAVQASAPGVPGVVGALQYELTIPAPAASLVAPDPLEYEAEIRPVRPILTAAPLREVREVRVESAPAPWAGFVATPHAVRPVVYGNTPASHATAFPAYPAAQAILQPHYEILAANLEPAQSGKIRVPAPSAAAGWMRPLLPDPLPLRLSPIRDVHAGLRPESASPLSLAEAAIAAPAPPVETAPAAELAAPPFAPSVPFPQMQAVESTPRTVPEARVFSVRALRSPIPLVRPVFEPVPVTGGELPLPGLRPVPFEEMAVVPGPLWERNEAVAFRAAAAQNCLQTPYACADAAPAVAPVVRLSIAPSAGSGWTFTVEPVDGIALLARPRLNVELAQPEPAENVPAMAPGLRYPVSARPLLTKTGRMPEALAASGFVARPRLNTAVIGVDPKDVRIPAMAGLQALPAPSRMIAGPAAEIKTCPIFVIPAPPVLAVTLPRLFASPAYPAQVPVEVAAVAAASLPAKEAAQPVPPQRSLWAHAQGFIQNAPRDYKILMVAVPLLIALAFQPSLPKVKASSQPASSGFRHVVNASVDNFRQAVQERAAVALDEDFRSGLDEWTSRDSMPAEWEYDATGFVKPAALALYGPTRTLRDYQLQFLGMIDKKAMSWVVRAVDYENFQVVKLVVLQPGPMPKIGVTRYAVINGKAEQRQDTVVAVNARPDTLYRVRMDMTGDDFVLTVQGNMVDHWSEPRLAQGGVGFFNARGEESRVRWVQITHQYDMLGRLCAYLAPAGISSMNGSFQQ